MRTTPLPAITTRLYDGAGDDDGAQDRKPNNGGYRHFSVNECDDRDNKFMRLLIEIAKVRRLSGDIPLYCSSVEPSA